MESTPVQQKPVHPAKTCSQKEPDDTFRKLMDEDEERKDIAASLPSPLEMMRTQPQPVGKELKTESLPIIELVHKLVDKMHFQVQNGIEQTTLFLGEGSIFPGTEITLTHYDTAPNSFQIAFDCEPQIVESVADHLPKLENRLQKGVPKYRVRLGTPRIKALKN